MEQGPTEEVVLEQALKQGLPIPEKIRNAPNMDAGLQFYWSAFLDLTNDRTIGMSEGPIPWASLDRYAQRYGIEGEEFEAFRLIIKALDLEYLRFRERKREKERKQQEQKSRMANKSAANRPTRR